MTVAQRWLSTRVAEAPDSLRHRMMAALETQQSGIVHDDLAAAALSCAEEALRAPEQRASAFELLAADALMTHACEAAALEGAEAMSAFASSWSADRFAQLLPARTP